MKPSQSGRKALRKEKRKSKKIAKDVAYKKQSVNAGKVNKSSCVTQNGSKNINSLKKIINNAKLEMKTSSTAKGKSNTKLHNDISNDKMSSGPAFKKNLDSRMAALEEFINNEVNVSSGFDHDKKITKKTKEKQSIISSKKISKKPKNTIKDKEKLKALEKGIADDDREINEMYRQMRFNVKQKKSTTILRNIFGEDICGIFDVLESEPSEAHLLAEQSPLVVPKEHKPSKKKQKEQIALPKNAIVIDTKKTYFEQDEVPTANDNSEESADNTKLSTSALGLKSSDNDLQQSKIMHSLTNSNKRKLLPNYLKSDQKKIIPNECEFEGLDEEVKLPSKKRRKMLKTCDSVVEESPPSTNLKSIMKVPKKKQKKKDERLSVSFNLSENAIKIIPSVKKPSVLMYATDDHDSISNGDSVDDWDELNVFLDSMDNEEDGLGSISDEEDEDDLDSMSDQEISSEEEGTENYRELGSTDSEDDTDSDQEEVQDNEGDLINEGNKDSDVDMEAEFTDSEEEEDDCDESSVTSDSQVDSDQLFNPENVHDGLADGLTEDIYGRLRDEQGNIVEKTTVTTTAYTSPECRKKDPQLQEQLNSDAMKRVQTQLRGRLNRLAEVNLAGTVTMVSGLYKEHPRQLLNVVLAELLLTELAGEMTTLDRHCQECAVLLVAVAANVAEEVGAHILTDFVMSWHRELQKQRSNSSRLRNLIMFVSHLYSFGLMHSVLVFDMLRLLVKDLTPCNVDQLVQVVGSVAFQLRKDDPEALRAVILSVQQRGAEVASSTIAFAALPQLELLIQMLKAVKNNNESKMPQYDPTYTDHLRKLLKAFVGGDTGKSSPVRVTLEDLLLSETRGRWWVVGSAWTGGSLLRETTPAIARKGGASFFENETTKALSQDATKFSDSFMKLAENMRITRPPKVNILFALTVGSQDTNEAFLKLSQLSLTPAQEKLIFDVMLFCVQKMRLYKPFYGLLSMELCNHDNKYKRMLQHSLWDKFSDLDALKMKELKNLAKFVVDIVKQDTLNLSVLKTLPFADANKKVVSFLEDIFCQLFETREGCHVSRDAFKQLFKSKKLQPLRMQLRVFLQVFIAPKFENEEVLKTNPLFRQRLRSAMDILSSDQGALL